ncbi:conserved Plasmodium protein, unknown function [Plasmodium ovale curtisi]|uniref:Uncharacterized protein n=1 Tax=Plasmodium ovale curtisi TaxID=864141 RepID=A0A1A8W6A2_PLAOA|nr:conserved Plasmodium protein, unknown function [Plasmodium ovale curtisi]
MGRDGSDTKIGRSYFCYKDDLFFVRPFIDVFLIVHEDNCAGWARVTHHTLHIPPSKKPFAKTFALFSTSQSSPVHIRKTTDTVTAKRFEGDMLGLCRARWYKKVREKIPYGVKQSQNYKDAKKQERLSLVSGCANFKTPGDSSTGKTRNYAGVTAENYGHCRVRKEGKVGKGKQPPMQISKQRSIQVRKQEPMQVEELSNIIIERGGMKRVFRKYAESLCAQDMQEWCDGEICVSLEKGTQNEECVFSQGCMRACS